MDKSASRRTQWARSNLSSYAQALAAVALALLARRLLTPLIGNRIPFVTLFPAVAWVAIVVGTGPALVTSIVGLLGAVYLLGSPVSELVGGPEARIIGAGLYFVACGFMIAAGEMNRRSRRELERVEQSSARQAEQTMRAAAAQLRRFLEAVPSGLTHCSRDFRYLAANQAYAEMAGLRIDQIVGRPIVEVVGAEAFAYILPYAERALRGERVQYERWLPFAAGGRRRTHVVYTPEKNSAGEVMGWYASVTDITEFLRVQEQLEKVEKLAASGRMAASLAHEIQQPALRRDQPSVPAGQPCRAGRRSARLCEHGPK